MFYLELLFKITGINFTMLNRTMLYTENIYTQKSASESRKQQMTRNT